MATNPVTKQTNKEMIKKTEEKIKFLKEKLNFWVVTIRECDIREENKTDVELRSFFKWHNFAWSLTPRDCFYGAQVGCDEVL